MNNFKGYVLQSELSNKAGVANSLFRQLKKVEFVKMSGLTCVKKDSLPPKYKKIANNCLDLGRYWSFAHISKELGMSKDYVSSIERFIKINSKRVFHIKLFELNDDFIENIEKGLNPFKIRNKTDEELAKEIVNLQGLKIGFY